MIAVLFFFLFFFVEHPVCFKKLYSIKIITLQMFTYHLVLQWKPYLQPFQGKYTAFFSPLCLLLNNAPFSAQVLLPTPRRAPIKEPA